MIDDDVVAIDPGSERSGVVRRVGRQHYIGSIVDNVVLVEEMHKWDWHDGRRSLVVEMMEPRGMPTAKEEMRTLWWLGRMVQARGTDTGYYEMTRRQVKLHICGTLRATDSNIRQAIIDRFGGKRTAIGLKKTPGPLYGFKADIWQAMAVLLTWIDAQDKKRQT